MAEGSARARVAALVGRLAPGAPAAQQGEAALVLAHLGNDDPQNRDRVRECGGFAALVGLLAPGRPPAVQFEAARALTCLTFENAPNKVSVRECGGVAALVGLLAPGGCADVHEQAAGALANLCGDPRNRECVRACGGIALGYRVGQAGLGYRQGIGVRVG